MRKITMIVALVGAFLVGLVAPASAVTTGAQTFSLVGFNDRQTVAAFGVVSGVGSVNPLDEDTDEFVFDGGTFLVDHPETGGTFNLNELTCIGIGTFEGTYTLRQGTGNYAGIAGSGTYQGRVFILFERGPGGACSEETEPTLVFFQVTARGTTTLP